MSNCKVIALTNQKGGVGKTTTAVNLGVGLVQQGKKVLLIDADAQANLTMALGYNRPDDIPITLSTVMQNIIDDKSFDVSQGIIHHSEGVDLLPSNIELSGFEVRLINAMSRERVLKTYVNEVKKNYDYVLIDCMPSLGMITINALAAADSVIIPTQPHYLSAKGLELLLRSVSMVKRQINPKLRIDGILMTIPKFAGCIQGSEWFKERGQWQDGSFTPEAGHIIFFDWEGDGLTDHVGIVERVENGTVYTVEGNSGDACRQNSYSIGSSVIYGYGIPAY